MPDVLNLVLAHLGNHEDGACAIYLCVPISEDNGRITQWEHTHLLWKRGGDDPSGLLVEDLFPEAPIEPATVTLKKKKDIKANER